MYIYICIYSHIWVGKRSALKLKKRFKDTIKYYLKKSGLPVDQSEKNGIG